MGDLQKSLAEDSTEAEQAFERRLPELMAIPGPMIPHVNLDLREVAIKVLAISSQLSVFRETLSSLTTFDVLALEGLEEYALTLYRAQEAYELACKHEDVGGLLAEAVKLRGVLLTDARAAARRGLLGASDLSGVQGQRSFRCVSRDLSVLVRALSSAPRLDKTSGSLRAELTRARELSALLLHKAERRRRKTLDLRRAMEVRGRAFKLLRRAYEEVRAGMMFLRRREKDAERWVPSLFAKRTRRRKVTASADVQLTTDIQPVTKQLEPVVSESRQEGLGPFEQ